METEDVIGLPASADSDAEGQKNDHLKSGNGSPEANSLDVNEETVERHLDMEEDMDLTEDDFRAGSTEYGQVSDTVGDSAAVHASVETVAVVDKMLDIQNGRLIEHTTLDVSLKSGVKRRRTVSGEEQPTVHVTYNHLTRASKQKLESLLQQWSEWEAEHSSSSQVEEQVLESGEATYFPALRVGLEKTSSVSFWIDDETGLKPFKGFVPMESSTAPLYDRGFAIGLTSVDGSNNLEGGPVIVGDPPRCFNCGSYSHSLRECPKPFDRLAVSNARKEHKAKKNLSSGSRIPSRYYQSSQSGKYGGLKPGSLDAETRQLLGLAELDPPPWLNRMRELGYPPGYLAYDVDHPSGITIFGEEETRVEETEDGEIFEKTSPRDPPKKKTVEFPGINAPIPEKADERLWAPASDLDSRRSNTRSQHRTSRGLAHHDHRPAPPRDYREDGHPSRVEPSSYPPRYGNRYDYDYFGSRDYIPRPRSPGSERSDYISRPKSPGFDRSDYISRPRSPGFERSDYISRPRSPGFEWSLGERGNRYYSSYDSDLWDRDDRDRYGFSGRR
ncbi:PREDICTED: uncharacterized protein LOC104805556 [Tarenaya hassleriana]|uniref:uncharacterized protein LOC104805556 n=1 Tax=Tarenaya hassleriana TaxID=28532 RepID=UPI00053C1F23|nr:PREDICTED: uncharacterized protein LOC104805556 [Tarenaya hassleriana]